MWYNKDIDNMTEKCLDIISRITVEIHKDGDTKQKLGSGRRTVVTGPCLAVAGGGKAGGQW